MLQYMTPEAAIMCHWQIGTDAVRSNTIQLLRLRQFVVYKIIVVLITRYIKLLPLYSYLKNLCLLPLPFIYTQFLKQVLLSPPLLILSLGLIKNLS